MASTYCEVHQNWSAGDNCDKGNETFHPDDFESSVNVPCKPKEPRVRKVAVKE